jgi:hypothetical protein
MDAETQAQEDSAAATEQPDLWALGDISQFDEIFLTHYGPALSPLWPLDEAGRDALRQSVINVVGRFNRADDEDMIVPADYL